jgi:hypothetical protein
MVKKEEFLRENGSEEKEEQVVSRTDFPSDFIFGVATSAYQVRSHHHQQTMHIHHSLHFVMKGIFIPKFVAYL